MTEFSISVAAQAAGSESCTVVTVAGEADVTTRQLGDVLTEEAARKPRLLLVEMSALQFIDSSALRMIIQAHRRMARNGGVLAVVHPTSPVGRVMRLTGVDQLITVYDSTEEATEAVRQRNSQDSDA
jgi:anti-sigma B factor antagonist